MKLSLEKITNKHKDSPCVISLHGPSMEKHRDIIQKLQSEEKIIRISTNEWWEYFKLKPDYLVVSNGELNIQDSFKKTGIFCPNTGREYPKLVEGQSILSIDDVPLFYNMTADLSDPDFVEQNMTVDYLPYDTKHFKRHTCLTILNFKAGLPLIIKSPLSLKSISLITTFLFLNLPIRTVSPISIGKSTPSLN